MIFLGVLVPISFCAYRMEQNYHDYSVDQSCDHGYHTIFSPLDSVKDYSAYDQGYEVFVERNLSGCSEETCNYETTDYLKEGPEFKGAYRTTYNVHYTPLNFDNKESSLDHTAYEYVADSELIHQETCSMRSNSLLKHDINNTPFINMKNDVEQSQFTFNEQEKEEIAIVYNIERNNGLQYTNSSLIDLYNMPLQQFDYCSIDSSSKEDLLLRNDAQEFSQTSMSLPPNDLLTDQHLGVQNIHISEQRSHSYPHNTSCYSSAGKQCLQSDSPNSEISHHTPNNREHLHHPILQNSTTSHVRKQLFITPALCKNLVKLDKRKKKCELINEFKADTTISENPNQDNYPHDDTFKHLKSLTLNDFNQQNECLGHQLHTYRIMNCRANKFYRYTVESSLDLLIDQQSSIRNNKMNLNDYIKHAINIDIKCTALVKSPHLKDYNRTFYSSVSILRSIVTVLSNICRFKHIKIDVNDFFKEIKSYNSFEVAFFRLKSVIQNNLRGSRHPVSRSNFTRVVEMPRNHRISYWTGISPDEKLYENIKDLSVTDLIYELLYCLKYLTDGQLNGIVLNLFLIYRVILYETRELKKTLVKMILLINYAYLKKHEDPNAEYFQALKDCFNCHFCDFWKGRRGATFFDSSKMWCFNFEKASKDCFKQDRNVSLFLCFVCKERVANTTPLDDMHKLFPNITTEIEKYIYSSVLYFFKNSTIAASNLCSFLTSELVDAFVDNGNRLFKVRLKQD